MDCLYRVMAIATVLLCISSPYLNQPSTLASYFQESIHPCIPSNKAYEIVYKLLIIHQVMLHLSQYSLELKRIQQTFMEMENLHSNGERSF